MLYQKASINRFEKKKKKAIQNMFSDGRNQK